MRVRIDGKFVHVENDVKIIYDGMIFGVDDQEISSELHICATHEGIIKDVWSVEEDEPESPLATSSIMAQDIVEDME
jgi:hypothetical protein